MQKNEWFSSIPRLITIFVAIGLYGTALLTVIRRPRRPSPLPLGKTGQPSTSYSGPERRIYPRAKLGISIRYKLYSSSGGLQVFREAIVKDISEGGLLLEAPEKLSVNDRLELKLKLPEVSYFMLLRGTVVWIKELGPNLWLYNCGISISEIDPNDRKQIAKFVAGRQGHLPPLEARPPT